MGVSRSIDNKSAANQHAAQRRVCTALAVTAAFPLLSYYFKSVEPVAFRDASCMYISECLFIRVCVICTCTKCVDFVQRTVHVL